MGRTPVTHIRGKRLRVTYLVWLLAPVLLWLALRSISPGDILSTLSQVGWRQVLALLALNGLIVLTFCARWWIILRSQGYRVPYLVLALHRLAGFGVSYFTPGTQFGGEPLQVHLLQRLHGVPATSAAASVGLDRLVELLVNYTLLGVGVFLTLRLQLFDGGPGAEAMLIPAALLALPVVLGASLWAGRHPVSGILRRMPAALRASDRYLRIQAAVAAGEDQAFQFLRRSPSGLAKAVAISLVSWAAMLGEYWLAVRFLGISLTGGQLITAMTAARLAFLTPLPGGLGALEAGQAMVYQTMGLDPAVGLGLSLIVRARDVLLGATGLIWGAAAAGSRKIAEGGQVGNE
jgi:uncharacterized protein (TIRG00374 family)